MPSPISTTLRLFAWRLLPLLSFRDDNLRQEVRSTPPTLYSRYRILPNLREIDFGHGNAGTSSWPVVPAQQTLKRLSYYGSNHEITLFGQPFSDFPRLTNLLLDGSIFYFPILKTQLSLMWNQPIAVQTRTSSCYVKALSA